MTYIIRQYAPFCLLLLCSFLPSEGVAKTLPLFASNSTLVEDSICTNTFRDTFLTFSSEKATAYQWQLPMGARIIEQPSDTTAVIDWRNATLGPTQICVVAENACGESVPTCMDLFIQHCNTAPIAIDDSQSSFFEQATTIFVQNNDTDADGDALTTLVDATFPPSNGIVNLSGDAIIYTPDNGFTGIDSFLYILCDTGYPMQCDTATVQVLVDHEAPIGLNDIISTPSNTTVAIPVLINDNDPEGSDLTITLDSVTLPLSGSIMLINQEIVYTPIDGFTGTDRFEYIVCDSNDPIKCDRATVTVRVINLAPIAVDDATKVPAIVTSTIPVLDNDSDKEEGGLTVTLDASFTISNGSATTNGITINYTPDSNFTGVDSFAYSICDDGIPILCDTAIVTVQVINETPIATNDNIVISSNTDTLLAILANDIDTEMGTISVFLHPSDTAQQGISTLIDQQILYSPHANFTGLDTLSYYICDDGTPIQCDTATVFISVQNNPPIAIADNLVISSDESSCYAVLINDSDPENGQLILSLDTSKPTQNGMVTISNEQICYDPNNGFSGVDTVCYIICDDGFPTQCDTAILRITIDNQDPVAVNDETSTLPNEEVCIAVLQNDEDLENGNLTIALDLSKLPRNGTVQIANEEICYTPTTNYSGLDSLCYIICDDGIPSLCDTARILVYVDNQAPIAIDEVLTAPSKEELCIDVLANDIDPENGQVTITLSANKLPKRGTASIKEQEICYTPEQDFAGLDSLCYIVCDNGIPIKCDTATLFIAVVNQPPIAQDDQAAGPSGTLIFIPVLENDKDPENDPLLVTIDLTNLPQNGSITTMGDSLFYTPNNGFTGIDELSYSICEEAEPTKCDTATVTITILNQPPTAQADDVTTRSGEPLCVEVLANDSDPEFGLVRVSVDANKLPKHGTVSIQNNEICYVPNNSYSGRDSLCYVICDDGVPLLCDTAIIHILVDNRAPNAADDVVSVNTNEEICYEVLANDADVERGNLMIFLNTTKLPQHGEVTIRDEFICYTPAADFSGMDSLYYIACDDGFPIKCDTARLIIQVNNLAPDAVDDTIESPSGETVEIAVLVNDSDPEGNQLIINTDLIQFPQNGQVQLLGDLFLYMPQEGFTGVDQFEYSICDNGTPSLCDTAIVLITILNQTPMATNDMVSTPFEESVFLPVIANDTDPENGDLTITINPLALPSNGSISLENDSILYTPFRGFNGDDSFEYIICDDGTPNLCDTALATILVLNNTPIAIDDVSATPSNTPIDISVIGNDFDPENGILTVQVDTSAIPSSGMVLVDGNTISYIPTPNFTGQDTFQYVLCDDGIPAQCDTARVLVTVENLAPIAQPDIVITSFETPINIRYAANDSDPENGVLTVLDSPEVIPENGIIEVIDNEIIYTPNKGFTGTDQFSYLLCDDGQPLQCDTALIRVIVSNTPPIAVDDTIQLFELSAVFIEVLQNDKDTEQTIFTIGLDHTQAPENGTVSIQSDSILYTPALLFVGIDSFDYIICDTGMPVMCDTATAFIVIDNEPPLAINDTFSIEEDQEVLGNFTSNDSDPNNHPLVVQEELLLPPSLGILTFEEDGSFQYIPYAHVFGPDRFTYIVCDSIAQPLCDTATVFIEIESKGDPPIALNDINITLKNTAVQGEVLTNDIEPDDDDLIVTTTPVLGPTHGNLEIDALGQYTYTPIEGFIGEDFFSYEVCDADPLSRCDTASVQVVVIDEKKDQNRPPLGVDDYLQSTRNTTIINNISINDSDPDGDLIGIITTPFQEPEKGILTLSTNGEFIYQPEPDYTGTITFQYILFDLGTPSLTDTATVIIDILPNTDNAIFAIDDAFIGEEDQTIIGNILTNDIDPENDPLAVFTSPIVPPQHGTILLQEDGQFIYAPDLDYFGPDYFVYEVCDEGIDMICDQATVVLTVFPVTDTLCTNELPLPLIAADKRVCMGDTIHLFTTTPYPSVVLEIEDTSYQFLWFNANGDTLAITRESEVGIFSKDSLAIPPFSMKAIQGACASGFSNLLNIEIVDIIAANFLETEEAVICQQESVTLNAVQQTNIAYQWTIKNVEGILSTTPEVIIERVDTSTTFELTISSTVCSLSDSLEINIQVIPSPKVAIAVVDSGAICQGNSLFLEAVTDSLSYEYSWTGPANFIATNKNPIIRNSTTANNGIYELVIQDAQGCKSEAASLVIEAIEAQLTPPTIVGPTMSCASEMITLGLLEFYDTTYNFEWINRDGEVIERQAILEIEGTNALAIAPYRVRISQNDCYSDYSGPFFATTFEPPTAQIVSNTTSVCEGSTLPISAKLYENAIYEWRRIGSPTLFSNELSTILTNIQDEIAIELTVYHPACPTTISKDTLHITIESNNKVQPTASFVLNEDCSPSNLILNANVSDDFLEVNWIGPNEFLSNQSIVTIQEATEIYNGTYQVSAIDSLGCISTALLTINDLQETIATPTITSKEGAVCENSNILLEAPSYEGTNVRYLWYENDVLLTDSTNAILFIDDAKLDSHYDLAIQINACTLNAIPYTPIVLEKPRLTIAPVSPLLCATGTETISISTTLEGGQAPLELSWVGPNNFISTLANPSILNTSSSNTGTYTLSVTDQNNCSAVQSVEIDIQEGISNPVIQKEGGNCMGESINLNATRYENPNVQYEWDFPSALSVSSVTSPTLAIPSANENYIGDYIVTASINNCIVQSDTFSLLLSNRPTFQPTASFEESEACEASDLSLFANAIGTDLTYNWKGPNGFSSAIANPVIVDATPTNNGIYELTVTTPASCSATLATDLIDQIKTSQATPILRTSGIACAGGVAIIEAPIYQGESVAYNWLLNGGLLQNETSSQLIVQTTNNQEDQYQLIVEVDGCTLASDLYRPTVLSLPSVANITKSAVYCEGESVLLQAQTATPFNEPIEYTWSGPNGFEFINTTSTDTFDLILPSITTNQAGSYSLTIRVGDCTSETSSVLVSIQPGLIAPTLQVKENTICAGNQLSFTAQSSASTIVQYEWFLQLEEDSMELIKTTAVPSLLLSNVTAANTGSYLVRVVNENCISNFSNLESVIVFDVETDLTALSSINTEQPGCYGDPIQLSVPFYPTATYEWIGPAGFSSIRHNPVLENATELNEGEYFVMVKMEGCPAIISQPVQVQIHPKPTAPIISSNGPICKGDSLTFTVMNVANFGPTIVFDWFNAEDVLIASTTEPFRNFSNVPTQFSNRYYAIATNQGCSSERSNLIDIGVSTVEELIANAGVDQQFCAINEVTLQGNEITNGIGQWQSLSGATIENPTNSTTIIQDLVDGSNRFVWTINDPVCGGVASDTVEVFIGSSTIDQAIAGSDQEVCETNSVVLEAIPLVESEGQWSQSADQISQGIIIETPSSPTTTINGLEPGNIYRFTWVISQTDCPSFESDEVTIIIDDIPNEQAIIPLENLLICDVNEIEIEAALPVLSTGNWSIAVDVLATPSPTPIRIASPSSATTFVEGLATGENQLVWALSNGGCKNFSTDTLNIFAEGFLEANADDYVINFNDSLVLDIFSNDQISDPAAIQFIITRFPEFGTIREAADGSLTYIPTQNYFGRDQFRYKICPIDCSESCDTAVVDLAISGVQGSGACFIPNTISPNEDGSNDVFLVSCLTEFPDNQLSIYNRWGDKVFEQAPYQNEWRGDYEEQPLPAGTYFYVLQLTVEGEPLQGFISLFR